MQAATEVFPGWIRIRRLDGVTPDRHVRRFHGWKGGADVGNPLPPGATLCARVFGPALARAHAHWGDGIGVPGIPGHLGDPVNSETPFEPRQAGPRIATGRL
jgi:hypothetical protein